MTFIVDQNVVKDLDYPKEDIQEGDESLEEAPKDGGDEPSDGDNSGQSENS